MTQQRKSSPLRNSELAMIHIAAKAVGMDPSDRSEDSIYRSMLWSIARVRSAKDLDLAGRGAVLAHLAAKGWQDPRRLKGRRPAYQKGTQAALIRVLWTKLAQAGEVVDGSDKSLRAYVRSQSATYHPSQLGWDDANMLPRPVAAKVIEHLKQWCERAGVKR